MIDIDLSNILSLNEAYFGKNNLLLQIEDEFQKVIDKVKKNNRILNDKLRNEILIIESLSKKLFGFKTVTLTFTCATIGAVTLFSDNSIKKYKTMSSKGNMLYKTKYNTIAFKDNTNIGLISYFSTELILNNNLTAGECTAVYLHEIGHNFYRTDNINNSKHLIGLLHDVIKKPESLPVSVLSAVEGDLNIYPEIIRIIRNNKALDIFFNLLGDFTISYFHYTNMVKSFDFLDKIKYISPKRVLAMTLYAPLHKDKEHFSDDFASMYGYSNELSSGLLKLDNISHKNMRIVDKILVDNVVYDLLFLPLNIIFIGTSSHPSNITRVNKRIDYLEKEIRNNKYPKELEEELLLQLKENKKLLRDSTKIEKKDIHGKLFSKILDILFYKIESATDIDRNKTRVFDSIK